MTTKAHVEIKQGDKVAKRDIFTDGYPRHVGGIIQDLIPLNIQVSADVEALADIAFPGTRSEAQQAGIKPGSLGGISYNYFLNLTPGQVAIVAQTRPIDYAKDPPTVLDQWVEIFSGSLTDFSSWCARYNQDQDPKVCLGLNNK